MDKLTCLLVSCLVLTAIQLPLTAAQGPYAVRIGCGSNVDSYGPNGFVWQKDWGYTGGSSANLTAQNPKAPQLNTLRYFQLSDGPENCYNITVPVGHYLIRLFFAFGQQDNSGREPQFAVSIEGTLVYSLDQGWSGDPENAYKDSLAHIVDGAATVCFHSSGHGNPAIASIEVLQIYSNAYRREFNTSSAFIWRTVKRVSAGADKSGFGSDFSADPWGGDRYWETDSSLFLPGSRVTALTTPQNISLTNIYPNVYPMAIFQSATTTTTTNLLQSLSYTLPVQPNMNYSLWIYLAEISQYVNQPQQRVFDILVNDLKIFSAVDIVVLAGGPYKAYILNTTVMVEGRTLTLKFSPLRGPILVNSFELYELIPREASTLGSNVWALQTLKQSLSLPTRLGWNGDPCGPQQYPWTGINCGLDATSNSWFIDGLDLDAQGLQGFIGEEIGALSGLQVLNMSHNILQGPIPEAIGKLTALTSLDLSYNHMNGSIPASLGSLPNLQKMYLSDNQLTGEVPSTFGAGAHVVPTLSNIFNLPNLSVHLPNLCTTEREGSKLEIFANNPGLCGVGLGPCVNSKKGAKAGIAIGVVAAIVVVVVAGLLYWKRRSNIARAQRLPRDAPYAKARTTFVRDVQLARTVLTDHFKPVYRDPAPTQTQSATLL